MINTDPRTKIIIVFAISSTAVIMNNIEPLVLLLLLTLLLCRLFYIPLLSSIKKLKKIWSFFLVLALVQSIFTKGGDVLLRIGGFNLLTVTGLEIGISIILRMSIIIYSAMIIASVPAMKILYALIAMKLPYEIAFMVLLSIKFLPLFREEYKDSIIAVQLAGADLTRIPLRQKLSLYPYILTPAVIKALSRAKYIALSMECRAFRAYPVRTSYCKLSMKMTDLIVLLLVAAAILSITILYF